MEGSTKFFDNYERFFKSFQRPPFAPTYYPTTEEFLDPIAFVAKIRPEAEKYGVVKIVPPEGFAPTFAIDKTSFQFTPREQRLNEVEALLRERACFLERLEKYWELQGSKLRAPQIDGRILDLFRSHVLIRAEGGHEAVTENKRWTYVAKCLGIKSNQGGSKVKESYLKLVHPFVMNIEEKESAVKKEEEDSEDESDKKEENDDCRGLGEGRSSMQGGKRMMGGTKRKGRNILASQWKTKVNKSDKIASVVCMKCNKGDGDTKLVLCEDCENCMHTYCMQPAMKDVPKGDWRCPTCVARQLRRMPMGFGFYDSNSSFNLDSFSEFANDFKKEYFKMDPQKVPIDVIEKTFWRKVIDLDDTVTVKYGADLITSKVGSGFVRKEDKDKVKTQADRIIANHPWNLNNMPVLRDSVLTHFDSGISGMMVPWVYVGMCFSTFCWHTEDHWTYSVNYNHWGERKVWYGVGGEDAQKFEDVVRELCPSLFRGQPDLLHHMTTTVNPYLLRSKGVRVTTVHQNAGEFVITFPRAYHAGFNAGLNFAEAVNFAPLDWLRMGRLAMKDYALVRRYCVFSHDELVFKMVHSCDKLSISMAVAALDELKEMSIREQATRSFVVQNGVTRTCRVEFEKIADDGRACRICNTTLFMSALMCSHGRIVCLEHMDKICQKCPPQECLLQYRYSMEELVPLVERLKERTKMYDEWEDEVETVLQCCSSLKKKCRPSLSTLVRLVDTARNRHFPSSDLLSRLLCLHSTCHSPVHSARMLLANKIRVRNKTRIQRADTRLDIGRIEKMKKDIDELPVSCEDIVEELGKLVAKVVELEKKVKKMMEGKYCRSKVIQLLKESEELDVKVDSTILLEKWKEECEWNEERADPFISWRPIEGMEMTDDFIKRLRWKMEELEDLMNEGKLVGAENGERMKRLQLMKDDVMEVDCKARRLVSGNGDVDVKTVMELWKEARNCDWCSSDGLDSLREEVDLVFQVRSYEEGSDCTWTDLCRCIQLCDRSRALRNSIGRSNAVNLLEEMTVFTKGLVSLFMQKQSYFSLYEIISFREDIVVLTESQPPPPLHISNTQLAECWLAIDHFDSRQQLVSHVQTVVSQEEVVFRALRRRNDKLDVRQTCRCQEDRKGRSLTCLICHSLTHEGCAWWDPFLSLLPPGVFLCIRCLRGKRPIVEDVEAVMSKAPNKALEKSLVAFVLETVKSRSDETRSTMEEWNRKRDDERLSSRLTSLILSILSIECIDSSILTILVEPIQVLFKDMIDEQMDVWTSLRNRKMELDRPLSLFIPCSKRSNLSPPKKKRRMSRTGDNETDSLCAHPECINPYTASVTWVHCERCRQWFHVVCTAEIVDIDEDYECIFCRKRPKNNSSSIY